MKAFHRQKKIFYLKQARKIKVVKHTPTLYKFLFFLNGISVLLLLIACVVPYISDERFSFLTFLSLTVPFLVIANLLFLVYWLWLRKLELLLSAVAIGVAYLFFGTFYKFTFSKAAIEEEGISVMSYNVRGFNKYGDLPNRFVFEDIKSFVDKEQPDIICFQEAGYSRKREYLKDYPYHDLQYIYMNKKVLLGVFSKYPIVKSDFICFPDSFNNAMYVDVLYKKDTVRVYNVHLQSLGVTPGMGSIVNQRSDKLLKKVSRKFHKQQQQAKLVRANIDQCKYKKILCGDFNNTQFSYAYKTLRADLQDTFIEKGSGYGRTLNFHKVPLRIDFIFADKDFKIQQHKNYDLKLSDHYPIMARLKLTSN